MIIVAGEILIDRFPEYQRIGGAPFNFAFHLKKLGWPVRFITRIGDDSEGRLIQHALSRHGFDLQDAQIDGHHRTGIVNVSLDHQGVPRFDIRKDAAYDHIDLSVAPAVPWSSVRMVYFGTLAQRTRSGYAQYRQFLMHKPESTIGFCDLNLRTPHLNDDAIKAALQTADVLKLNDEELGYIGQRFHGPQTRKDLAQWVRQTFDIDLLVITLGAHGSFAISAQEVVRADPAKVAAVVDTVGAGDGYAAMLAGGLLNKLPLATTTRRATEFAAHICGLPGATPDDNAYYHKLQQQLGKETP